MFFREFFSNVTIVWVSKIGLLIPEHLLPDLPELVKRLKGDIITVQCAYIKRDLMLLFKVEQKIFLIYIRTFLLISQNSGKDLLVNLWNTSQYERIQKAGKCNYSKYYSDEITNGAELLKRCINYAGYRISNSNLGKLLARC